MGVKQEPVVSQYKIKSNATLHLRLALAADLHEEDGSAVVDILNTLSPDLILIPGDIIETYDVGFKQLVKDEHQIYLRKAGKEATNSEFQSLYVVKSRFPRLYFAARVAVHLMGMARKKVTANQEKHGEEFLKNVSGIAPCFFSKGNHDDLLDQAPTGIQLLENEYVVMNTGGEDIAIGGVSRNVDIDWLDKFAQLPAYHILLCHYPEMYEPLFKSRRIELIVSGHAHGGQIRIGGRGLYAPGQGLFPKYTKGVYDNRLVVTTGLCNNGVIPRCGNPMEVVLIEIV